MQKLTNLLFELYLPLFWKNAEVCISQVFNQSIESLMFLSQWLETIYTNTKARVQITAYTEAFNLKHNTIVLGISSYYPQKYMSGTPLKCQKRWGFRGLRPLTPTKGLCPLDPRRGHRPRTPPQIKMKWRPCFQCPILNRQQSLKRLFNASSSVDSILLRVGNWVFSKQAIGLIYCYLEFNYWYWTSLSWKTNIFFQLE